MKHQNTTILNHSQVFFLRYQLTIPSWNGPLASWGPFHECEEHLTKKFLSPGRSIGYSFSQISIMTIQRFEVYRNRQHWKSVNIIPSRSSRTEEFFRKMLLAFVKRAPGARFTIGIVSWYLKKKTWEWFKIVVLWCFMNNLRPFVRE